MTGTGKGPLVLIVAGSESDRPVVEKAEKVLREAGVAYEFEVASAHRTPDRVAELARGAEGRGVRVVIAAAGLAAALPGVMAAHSKLPVIGLPVGFVNAAESKAMLVETNVPYISNVGRKGGSNVAASVVNALILLALEQES